MQTQQRAGHVILVIVKNAGREQTLECSCCCCHLPSLSPFRGDFHILSSYTFSYQDHRVYELYIWSTYIQIFGLTNVQIFGRLEYEFSGPQSVVTAFFTGQFSQFVANETHSRNIFGSTRSTKVIIIFQWQFIVSSQTLSFFHSSMSYFINLLTALIFELTYD